MMPEPHIAFGAVLTPKGAQHFEQLEARITELEGAIEGHRRAVDLAGPVFAADNQSRANARLRHKVDRALWAVGKAPGYDRTGEVPRRDVPTPAYPPDETVRIEKGGKAA